MRSASLTTLLFLLGTAALPAQSPDPERLQAVHGEYAGALQRGPKLTLGDTRVGARAWSVLGPWQPRQPLPSPARETV